MNKRIVPGMVAVLTFALTLAGCSLNDQKQSSGNATTSDGTFSVNTKNCLDPTAATAKLGDTIKIGYSAALSGPVFAAQKWVNVGYKARIDQANATNELDGKKIELTYEDDAYDPQKAKSNVSEFINKDHVDVLVTAGGGQLDAVADDQNQACVPVIGAQSSLPKYRDAASFPWTTQSLPDANFEMASIIDLVKKDFPDGADIGVIVAQSESGQGYLTGLKAAIKGTNVKIVATSPSTQPAQAAADLKASGANVLVNASIGADCLNVPLAVAKSGWQPKMMIQPSACADPETIYKPAGEAANGIIIMQYNKLPGNSLYADDPAMKAYEEAITKAGENPNNNYTVGGWDNADTLINILKTAMASKGGLSHASIINTARVQNYHPALFLDGIDWVMNPAHSMGIVALQPFQWSTESNEFKPLGDLIDQSQKYGE